MHIAYVTKVARTRVYSSVHVIRSNGKKLVNIGYAMQWCVCLPGPGAGKILFPYR